MSGSAKTYHTTLKHSLSRWLIGASLTTLSACVAFQALAQDAASPPETPPPSDGIEEVIVTAQRVRENLQTTPVAVSALTETTLQRQQVTNISNIQYSVPSLQLAPPRDGDSSGANIGIRGQIQTFSSITVDPSVGLYVDGVYVARMAGAALDLVDVERAEVLRGPQGTLFGRNTTGGAINIIANKPKDRFEGSIRARAGNYGLGEFSGMVNLPLVADAVALRIVMQSGRRDGYAKSLTTGQEFGDRDDQFLRAQLNIAPDAAPWSILLSADTSSSKTNGAMYRAYNFSSTGSFSDFLQPTCQAFPALPSCPTGAPPLSESQNTGFYETRSGLTSYMKSKTSGLSATAQYDFGPVTVKSITSYRKLKRTAGSDLDGTPYAILDVPSLTIDQESKSEELQFLGKAFDNRLSWIGGYYYFSENGLDTPAAQVLVPLLTLETSKVTHAENTSNGIFAQGTYEVSTGLRLTLGARQTKDERSMALSLTSLDLLTGQPGPCGFIDPAVQNCLFSDTVEFDAFSYTAGIDWQPTPGVFLYGKLTKGYRSGGFNQGGVDAVSLAPYDPETVLSNELGAKLDLFNRKLRINTAVFYSKYEDIQRATARVVAGTVTNFVINAAEGHIQGLELEVTAKPISKLTLNGTFGYTETAYDTFIDRFSGLDRSDEPFPQTPKYTAGIGADYVIPASFGDFTLHADYAWRSEQFYDTGAETSRVKSYGLLNALVTLDLANDVTLSLWGRNLLDKKYYAVLNDLSATALGYAAGSPGEPATYGISAGWKF